MQIVLETIVQWGDCDEQGIVFYPQYFHWMHCCYQRLLQISGLNQRLLRTRFGVVGTPPVEAEPTFAAPVTYGQRLTVGAVIARWGYSSFEIAYGGLSRGRLVFKGTEDRVWLTRGDDNPRGTAVPGQFCSALGVASPAARG